MALDRVAQGRGRADQILALDPCACRKSNTHIQLMKSAKKWLRQNATNGMYRSRRRRVLVDRKVRVSRVIVMGVKFQNPTQMCLAQVNDVVQTLTRIDPISRSAKPFCQGEAGAVGLSRMPMAACDDAAIDPIPIADEVTRRFIP